LSQLNFNRITNSFPLFVRRGVLLLALSSGFAGCELMIRSHNGRTPPAPDPMTLLSPLTSPNSIVRPTIRIAGLVANDLISLHTSSDCSSTSSVASATATGTTIDFTPSALPIANYAFYAKATDPDTGNSACSAPLVYNLLSVTHQGWLDIKALGPTTVHADSGLTPSVAAVTLTWNAPTLSSGTIGSYNIYRSTTSGGQDYASPIASGISASAKTYTDNTVVAGTTYYYTVAPVVSGSAVRNVTSADAEVKIIIPPDNMVLIHRWAANQEMCSLMGRTIDRDNHYRCPYTGPGGTGVYYDVGRSNLVDAYELGCNYTPAPGCGDAVNGCLGTAPPAAGVGSVNDVFYTRATGTCYVKTAAATWTPANTPGLSAAFRALMSSNKRGLPPLSQVDQPRAYESCQAQTSTGFAGNKKLLTHQQQIIASAWDRNLSDATTITMEAGNSLNTTGFCNANFGSGLVFDNLVKPAQMDTLPNTTASNHRAVRGGSIATQNCVSRYGAQDMLGNIYEWSSDQLATCSSVTHTCTGQTSALDPNNTDWNGFNFNGSIGPGGGGSAVTNWLFTAMSFSATRFLVPLGLPMVTAAPAIFDSLAIGSGAGQFDPAKFHGDAVYLGTDNPNGTPARGVGWGGCWENADANRFSIYMGNPAVIDDSQGARCALPAE
jgi:hypothetical protein